MAREPLIPTGRSKSQQAYQWIRERIATQEFASGYRLVLSSIATDTGMSVVPVREAIRQLEAEGLVTFERNIGAHVSMINASQYRHSMQALGIVEGSATALAARHLTVADIKRARAVNQQMIRILDPFDPHRFTELNHEFHSVLFSRCPNARLVEIVNAEWVRLGQLRDSTFSFVPGRAQWSVREHEEIVALIERSAPLDEIEQAARRHREATLDAYLTHVHAEEKPSLAAG
jgi:DNA-binding GntR family transcriptional regulator